MADRAVEANPELQVRKVNLASAALVWKVSLDQLGKQASLDYQE